MTPGDAIASESRNDRSAAAHGWADALSGSIAFAIHTSHAICACSCCCVAGSQGFHEAGARRPGTRYTAGDSERHGLRLQQRVEQRQCLLAFRKCRQVRHQGRECGDDTFLAAEEPGVDCCGDVGAQLAQRQVQRHRVDSVEAWVGGRGNAARACSYWARRSDQERVRTSSRSRKPTAGPVRTACNTWTSRGELAASRAAPRAPGHLGEPLRHSVGTADGGLEVVDRDPGSPDEAPRMAGTWDGQIGGLVEPPEQVPQVRDDVGGEAGERVEGDRRAASPPRGPAPGCVRSRGEPGAVPLVQPAGVQVEGAGRCGQVCAARGSLLVGDRGKVERLQDRRPDARRLAGLVVQVQAEKG